MEFTKEDKDKLGQILKELNGIKDVLKGGEGSGVKGHKKWSGETDSGSEYYRLRQKGKSHDEAVADIER